MCEVNIRTGVGLLFVRHASDIRGWNEGGNGVLLLGWFLHIR